ncbi:ATPase, T2SS/T4P/T4SS family [Candidatus Harpocratesius sp.]
MMDYFKIDKSDFSLKNHALCKLIPKESSFSGMCSEKDCFYCIFTQFVKYHQKDFEEVQCPFGLNLSKDDIEIFTLLKKLYKKMQKVYNNMVKSYFKQKRRIIKINHFSNRFSISFFFEIINKKSSLQSHNQILDNQSKTENCSLNQNNIRKFVKLLEQSRISEYLRSNYAIFSWNIQSLKDIIPNLKKKDNLQLHKEICSNSQNVIEKYLIFQDMIIINIIRDEEYQNNKIYYEINLGQSLLAKFDQFYQFLESKISKFNFLNNNHDLTERIIVISSKFNHLLDGYYKSIKEISRNKIAFLLTLKFLKIESIFIFLQDENIEEIFLDEQDNSLYFNHQIYGRLESNIKLNRAELEAIQTYVCLESKKRLDFENPSITHVFQSQFFYARISIDIYPSHWKNISIDIRNLKKKTLTLMDLLRLNTLNHEIASFLVFLVYFRINITIFGEVNSGKTTLLNAIDLFVPSTFRKIYLEENIETLEIFEKVTHQLKFKVEPETSKKDNKQKQIYNLLHRSGDFIILGEILSKLETKAMFHCLSAGLKGLQTTHASSINGLLNRWIIHYNINPSCLNDLGIIVFMKKLDSKRIIQSIYQVVYNSKIKEIKISPIFNYNFEMKKWIKNTNEFHSLLTNNYNFLFTLDLRKLEYIFNEFLKFFKSLSKNQEYDKFLIFKGINKIYRNINNYMIKEL